MEGLKQNQVINKLQALVTRVRLQSPEYADLEIRVSPPNAPGNPYTIDVSKGRISRQVTVDAKAVEQMQYGTVDALITRDLRAAMSAVSRLSHTKKN